MRDTRHDPFSAPATAAAARAPGDRPTAGDADKRRAYLVVVGLAALLLGATAVVDGPDVPYWGWVRPLLALFDVGLLVVIWRAHVSARTIEGLLLVPTVLVLLGFLVTWRLAPALVADQATDPLMVMLWLGITYPLCFLVFGTRRGLGAALAVYAAFLLLVVPPAVSGELPGLHAGSPRLVVVMLSSVFAVSIALLWVLASRLEQLAAARTEARLFAAQASTDALTGLPNRRWLDEALDQEIAGARRSGDPLSVVLADVDEFKGVNDRLGHAAGDQVLIELAHRLAAAVRSADLLGRWGGEELLLLAPRTGHTAAVEVARRCRARIADRPFTGAGHVTASFGVATLRPDDDARSLLARADLALYAAKRDGRDRVTGSADLVGASFGARAAAESADRVR